METPVVNRNNETFTLSPQTFGKRSPQVGTTFYSPVANATNWETFIKWFGIDEAIVAMNTVGRRIFATIFLDHLTENDGIINEAELLEEYATFSAGRESLGDLDDQIDDLQTKQQTLLADPDLQLNEEGQPVTKEAIAILAQMRALSAQIKPLKSKKADIEAEYARRAAKRKDDKAKKAVKAS